MSDLNRDELWAENVALRTECERLRNELFLLVASQQKSADDITSENNKAKQLLGQALDDWYGGWANDACKFLGRRPPQSAAEFAPCIRCEQLEKWLEDAHIKNMKDQDYNSAQRAELVKQLDRRDELFKEYAKNHAETA